ncbi:MAG TPA: hypothetical protein VJK00_11890 [Steroidobacteraceae bacterium]|jgi:hypothetical protein|nr:hypothetical protein [Steroidobacteraceae bacterium]
MQATEHIVLESDERRVPALRTARKVHSRLRVQSSVRRRASELALIDYCYLSVRTWRSRSPDAQYVLDLRFVDPALRLSRHVAWRFLAASAVLAVLAVALAWRISASSTPWRHEWLLPLGGLFGLAVCAALVGLYRTTKTLVLFSVSGRARLLELTGGVGSFRAMRSFSRTLAAHVRIASARRRRSRAEHLRDEMREHLRLKEAGVLSEKEYEMSKARILAKHA